MPRLRDRTLDLQKPAVMGILNATPDSFSDGGLFFSVDAAMERIAQMVEEGADIIDIGGESTRPGSDPVPVEEELKRIVPLLEQAVPEFSNCLFSIDTTKAEVASAALQAGVHLVNDVSGLKDPRLAELCAASGAGYVLMHSKGDPKTMQQNPVYEDLMGELDDYFSHRLKLLKESGVNTIILDPGVGFGKTLDHNLQIIAHLGNFSKFDCPVLVGVSRKSMIGKILDDRPVEGRLAGTLAAHYHCLVNGARILRVHDVQEAKDSIQIFHAIQTSVS